MKLRSPSVKGSDLVTFASTASCAFKCVRSSQLPAEMLSGLLRTDVVRQMSNRRPRCNRSKVTRQREKSCLLQQQGIWVL